MADITYSESVGVLNMDANGCNMSLSKIPVLHPGNLLGIDLTLNGMQEYTTFNHDDLLKWIGWVTFQSGRGLFQCILKQRTCLMKHNEGNTVSERLYGIGLCINRGIYTKIKNRKSLEKKIFILYKTGDVFNISDKETFIKRKNADLRNQVDKLTFRMAKVVEVLTHQKQYVNLKKDSFNCNYTSTLLVKKKLTKRNSDDFLNLLLFADCDIFEKHVDSPSDLKPSEIKSMSFKLLSKFIFKKLENNVKPEWIDQLREVGGNYLVFLPNNKQPNQTQVNIGRYLIDISKMKDNISKEDEELKSQALLVYFEMIEFYNANQENLEYVSMTYSNGKWNFKTHKKGKHFTRKSKNWKADDCIVGAIKQINGCHVIND
uniref:FERM domain-containing protein n=1 Tax=Rhabditophanes sp. KR3021 TaxID=114890 RepID=A0AC35TYE4_9BILA